MPSVGSRTGSWFTMSRVGVPLSCSQREMSASLMPKTSARRICV
jgi:hypothetical protein